jgi:hypothetical protein
MWFANIFYRSVGCLFILLIGPFDAQKCFILMKLICFFSFRVCAFGVIFQKFKIMT